MVQMVLNVRSLEHYWCNVLPLLGVSLWLCRHWSERVIFSDKEGRMNFHSHGMFHCHYYFSRDFQADIIISHNTKDLSSRLGSLVCDDRWFGLWDIAERGREREKERESRYYHQRISHIHVPFCDLSIIRFYSTSLWNSWVWLDRRC